MLRRWGIFLPYSDVICAEYAKGISLDGSWRAQVTVEQKLVFLKVPERGDLFDVCPLDSKITLESFRVQSADSMEIGRRRAGRNAAAIDWTPRVQITPYAIYEHHHTWSYPSSSEQTASSVEYHCKSRTGMFLFEMTAPESFDAVVVFERPRWTNLSTEKRLIKYALKKLGEGAERPAILDEGQRVQWRIVGPKIGARFICVAFHHNGVLRSKELLEKSSFFGGMRQLMARKSRV